MPTFNRRAFVPLAVRYFQRQDYPNAELLVLDDGSDPVADCLPGDRRIRYVRLKEKLTIGAKRNLACAQSCGDFIVHWDDDDWQPPDRIRRQVAALAQQNADVCGSSRVYYYDTARDQSWLYEFRNRQKPWLGGNTLAYRRSLWERNKFPEVQVGEDARFLWTHSPKKILDIADPALCVGMIHDSNASPKDTKAPWWQLLDDRRVQQLLGSDLDTESDSSLPLITCIMPTRNRRSFVVLALSHFSHQDYPNRELIIVDDGEEFLGDLVGSMPAVSYVRLNGTVSIGYKRNLAVQQARGSLIAHWDDDDWYAPARLRYQASPILAGIADITGLVSSYVLDICREQFWRPSDSLHRHMFVGDVHGGTLLYRKSLWLEGVRYPEINLAEDAMLIRRALQRGKRLERMANPGVFIYMRHDCNAWRFSTGEFLQPTQWSRVEAPPAFHQILSYRAAQSQAKSYTPTRNNP
jgi:glycosyltransferase involved in cell wall biosynthesis